MVLTGYFGVHRNTEVNLTLLNEAEAHSIGAGKVPCQECGGDGDWGKFMPEPTSEPCPCVVCKGTGYMYVST